MPIIDERISIARSPEDVFNQNPGQELRLDDRGQRIRPSAAADLQSHRGEAQLHRHNTFEASDGGTPFTYHAHITYLRATETGAG